jgi:hypothetical protein
MKVILSIGYGFESSKRVALDVGEERCLSPSPGFLRGEFKEISSII